jgi:hypothetical protein
MKRKIRHLLLLANFAALIRIEQGSIYLPASALCFCRPIAVTTKASVTGKP